MLVVLIFRKTSHNEGLKINGHKLSPDEKNARDAAIERAKARDVSRPRKKINDAMKQNGETDSSADLTTFLDGLYTNGEQTEPTEIIMATISKGKGVQNSLRVAEAKELAIGKHAGGTVLQEVVDRLDDHDEMLAMQNNMLTAILEQLGVAY